MNYLYSALFLLVPFVFLSGHPAGFELPKVVLFYGVADAIGVLFFIKNRGKKFNLDLLDWLIIFYVLLLITSSVLSGNLLHSLIGGPFRYQGILTYFHLGLLFILTRKINPNIYKVIMISGILQSFLLIYQFVQFNFLNLEISTYAGRVIGTFGEPNYAAGFLLAAFGISLGLNLIKSSRFAFMSGMVTFLGILVSESLGGILAAVIVSMIYLYLKNKHSLASSVGKNKLILLLTIGIIIFSGFAIFQKEKITFNEFGIATVESRFSIWPASFDLFLKRPIVGYGAENLAFVFPSEFGGSSIDRAHNALLENLLMGGIFMGLIYIYLVYKGLSLSFKHLNLMPVFLPLLGIVIRDQFNVSGIVNLYILWMFLSLSVPRLGLAPR